MATDNNKLKMQTKDKADENFEKLSEMFPNAVTETINEKGEIVRAIDKDVLSQEISATVVDRQDGRYQFTWPDKNKSIICANEPIEKTLRPCREESVDFDNTENLYIEGDNLEVLKLLQETYLGKVKMIYIDPPYNTGHDFIYEDDFSIDSNDYKENSGQVDDEGNRLVQNLESNGRFHTDWLNMMYPRLKLARDLLADDGVIFISIDDNEQANLKKICDEIFGECNFICDFIWEKSNHFGRQKMNFYNNADHLLCYSKNYGEKRNGLLVEKTITEFDDAPLFNASNNEKSIVFPARSVRFNISDGIYSESNSDKFKILTPVSVVNGLNENDLVLRFKSRWSNQTIVEEIAKGTRFIVKTTSFSVRAIYGDDKTSRVAPRQIIFTNQNSNSLVTKDYHGCPVGTNEEGTRSMRDLLGTDIFSYPKPVSVIKYLVSLRGSYEDSTSTDAIILDFFSGSATTAHAVMQLNAEDSLASQERERLFLPRAA